MVKIRVTKLESTHNNLSKSTYVGYVDKLPVCGEDLLMYDKFLHTTTIKSLTRTGDQTMTITTANSTYLIEVLK